MGKGPCPRWFIAYKNRGRRASVDINDENELLRADIYTTVALLYDDTGAINRAETLERRKKCLDVRQAYAKQASSISREDSILLYNAWMDYVLSLMQYNKYQEAEPILKTGLAKYQLWGSEMETPFEYAKISSLGGHGPDVKE